MITITDHEVDEMERFYQAKREGEREDVLTLCANLRYARDDSDRWRALLKAISDADCIKAIEMVQAAVRSARS
jgi:hypothetical protein